MTTHLLRGALCVILVGCHESHPRPEQPSPPGAAMDPAPMAPMDPRSQPRPTDDGPAVFELLGEHENAAAGMAVALSSDVTGDGQPDLIVGAPGEGPAGTLYIYPSPVRGDGLLAAGLPAIDVSEFAPGVALGPRGAGTGTVIAVGDLGRQLPSIVAGAPGTDGEGAAVLIDDSDPQVFRTDEPMADFGRALAFIPTGDTSLLAIGVPHAGPDYAGDVRIWRTPDATRQPDIVIRSGVLGGHAGSALASGCDVDGDGYADLLVGAWGDDEGASGGAAYLMRGPFEGPDSLEAAHGMYVSRIAGAAAGSSVLLADVTGDSLCDVIIGAPSEDDQAGTVYGFFGPAAGRFDLRDADFVVHGANAGDGVGASLAAGDHDGDGVLDLWLGAPGHDANGPQSGAVYMIPGPPEHATELADVAPQALGGQDAHLGHSLAAGFDLDGDGSPDVAAGAWGVDGEFSNQGAVYVLRNRQ